MNQTMTWALTYLLLIPLFAGLYLLTPSEFRHSTLPYESDVRLLKSSIDDEVLSLIREHRVGGVPDSLPDGTWQMVATSSDQAVISYWLLFVERVDRESIDEKKQQITLSYSCQIPLNISSNHKKEYYTMNCFEMSIADLERSSYTGQVEGDFRIGYGFVGKENIGINQLINKYRLALDGNDSSAGFFNRYIRMLYFSTVTHTTLGYGDIVPINTVARSLVAFQSILGIVVMGLFLNSIARNLALKKSA